MQSSSGSNIHFYSLRELVDKYSVNSSAVLKLDCEGCEYDIVLSNDTTVFGKFSHIQIEYHYGYEDLKKHMIGAGFAVSHTNPKVDNKGMQIGWIYATKS